MFGDFPRKQHIGNFRWAWGAFGDDFQIVSTDHAAIVGLRQKPTRNRFDFDAACVSIGHVAGD